MIRTWKSEIESRLPGLVPAGAPGLLREAMLYSLMAGGKRFRPLLVLATACALGKDVDSLFDASCAVEYIHTYSLIHDDLPAMDDDTLRRGKPTSHVKFGEAIAILAGDALNTEAFHILSVYPESVEPGIRASAVAVLARASGASGMAGGQILDMISDIEEQDEDRLKAIHLGKTARLIQASVVLGALYGGADSAAEHRLGEFGEKLGLLFQITDDILDETSTAEAMGKSPGKDREQGKITAPGVYGLEKAIETARSLADSLSEVTEQLGPDAAQLNDLVSVVTSHLPE